MTERQAKGLYDPAFERDSCGFGLIANLDDMPSHWVVATAIAFLIQTMVQRRLSAVQTAAIIITEPIFAAIFGYLLAGDRLTPLAIFGAVLMVGALIATEFGPSRLLGS